MATAYRTLRSLGPERFDFLVNALMRGTPATKLARDIQLQPPEGWGALQNLTESSIGLQLNRLRLHIAEGAFGAEMAQEIAKGNTPQIPVLAKISTTALERMEELAGLQRERVLQLVAREKKNLIPQLHAGAAPKEYMLVLTQTNQVFTDYQDALLNLQKLRFDLGLDEFKGPMTAIRGASQTVTTTPEGQTVQKQVFEAVTTVEKIFASHRLKK